MSTSPTVSDFRAALAICLAYRISRENLRGAAHEVAAAMRGAPRPRRHAAAHRAARRLLAKDLGLAESALPASLGRAQAVGQFEEARGQCQQPEEVFAFDLHAKWFAAANGVCPRCAAPGRFTEWRGSCSCGFRYGPLGVSAPETQRDALEKVFGSARKTA